MVTAAMIASPENSGNPAAFMHSRPAYASGEAGSVSHAPCIALWPRGSSINILRRRSPRLRTQASFSAMVLPPSDGAPATRKRTVSPATWASMVVNLTGIGISRPGNKKRARLASRPLIVRSCPANATPSLGGGERSHLFLHPRIEVLLGLDRIGSPHAEVSEAAEL